MPTVSQYDKLLDSAHVKNSCQSSASMRAQGALEISLHTRKACQQWYKDVNGGTAQRPETQNATDCSSDACIMISAVVQELLLFLLALGSILLCSRKTRSRNATAAVILSLSLSASLYIWNK